MTDQLFTQDDIIFEYTLEQALEDGELVDANIGDLAEVTQQHTNLKVYMTRGLYSLIEEAVSNRRYANDWKGVWHDILWMSKAARARLIHSYEPQTFLVIITGTGSKRTHTLKVAIGYADSTGGVLHLVYMLEDED